MFKRFIASFKPRVLYLPDGNNIAKCGRCRGLLDDHMCRSLLAHLIDEHHVSEEAAIDTVNWVYKKLNKHLDKLMKAKVELSHGN